MRCCLETSLLALAWLCACSDDANEEAVSLRRDVMPILQSHGCAASYCHSDPNDARVHHTDFRTPDSTYESLLNEQYFNHCAEGSNEPIHTPLPENFRVTPGNPEESFLVEKLRDTRESCGIFYGRMPPPPAAPVPAAEIDVIERWILEGAQNN
jgi:hypothetical protein